MALLEACGLSKRFGGLQAFRDIDLALAEGEILGLIGPNGSGKTTFFNAVTGLHPATGGQILFADGQHDLTRLPPHRITALGIARTFQNQRCFNQMTVLENVLVGMHCRTRSGLASILAGTARRPRRAAPGARGGARAARASSATASRRAPHSPPSRCPTPTGGGWRSRARSPRARACCSSTSRPPA